MLTGWLLSFSPSCSGRLVLADPSPEGPFFSTIKPEQVTCLEQTIDRLETELEPLVQFILPGGRASGRPASPGPRGLPPR